MRRQLSSALASFVELRGAFHADDEVARDFARWVEFKVQIADGHYAAAERNARGRHEALRTIFGDEHEHTLKAAGDIAVALKYQLKHDGAAQIQRAVLDTQRTLGIADTASMSALATTLSHEGKFADSERLYKEAVEMSTSVLGAEHAETLLIRSNSASNLNRMGNHAKAADTLRDVIALQTRVLGAEHPATLVSMASFSTTLFSLGKRDEAVQLQRDVIAARRRLLGDTLVTFMSMGNLECMLEQLYAHENSALGEGHPKTLRTLRELVIATWSVRAYEQAIDRQRLLVSTARRAGHDVRQHETALRGMVRAYAAAQRSRQACSACAKECEEARACGRCRSALYCSVECQRAHWPTHKRACKRDGAALLA